jgi:hypothetical protein
MVDPTTGFAVGDSGTVLVYGGGTVWAPINVGPPPLSTSFYGVEANASGAWWVAGDNGTVIYGATRTGGFQHQSTNALVTLYSIRAVAGTAELFAVGDGGVIIHTANGASFNTTWSAQLSPTANALYFTGGPANTSFFAAGHAGVAAYFDGASWSSDAVGTSVNLRSGASVGTPMTPVTDVWLVGDGGTILHSTTGASGTWSAQSSGTTQNLFGIIADSATRAFAVGSMGTILHWDGTKWKAMATPTTANLRAIARGFSAPVDYWVVGECGTLLHGTL